jgi:hypothetical protein
VLYCKLPKIAVFVGAKQGSSALPTFDLRGSKDEDDKAVMLPLLSENNVDNLLISLLLRCSVLF